MRWNGFATFRAVRPLNGDFTVMGASRTGSGVAVFTFGNGHNFVFRLNERGDETPPISDNSRNDNPAPSKCQPGIKLFLTFF